MHAHDVTMEIHTYTDRLGQNIATKFYDGVYYPEMIPGDVKTHLDQLNTVQFSPSDVMLTSYPRSGE